MLDHPYPFIIPVYLNQSVACAPIRWLASLYGLKVSLVVLLLQLDKLNVLNACTPLLRSIESHKVHIVVIHRARRSQSVCFRFDYLLLVLVSWMFCIAIDFMRLAL